MNIIIDANLVFSSLIKPDGRIAEILLNPSFNFNRYSCYYLYVEIFNHKEKMLEISGLDEIDLIDNLYRVMKKITLINEETIPAPVFKKAYHLTKDIDEKDTPYVALTMHLDGLLWTGDKSLVQGLKQKKFNRIITTNQLVEKF